VFALAALFPQDSQATAADAGQGLGRAQAAIAQSASNGAAPLLALPNADAIPGYARHYSHVSHVSRHSHRSHYSSSGGGHYSHSSHSSHYSSS
jgi:hypothetical protein